MSTPNLKLNLLAAGQAQKHVTLNDALLAIDALAQLSVINRTQTAPPASPTGGAAYIIAVNPTDAFTNHTNDIAVFAAGEWTFYQPATGWLCYVEAEALLLVWSAGQWVPASLPNSPLLLGINASATTTNRLTVNSPASLFEATGSGHQLKINKAATANTASILYQTAYSSRAEIGLTGDDKLHCKVSANGTTWKEALIIDQTSGLATVFGAPTAANGIATKAYADAAVGSFAIPFDYQLAANQSISTLSAWTPIVNLTTARIASANFSTSQSRFTAPAAGTYAFLAQVVHTAGAAPTTVTIAVLKNGNAAGNWVSQSIAAGAQGNASLSTILSLVAGDTVALGIYAQAATTVNFGFTSFFGYRL